jgi:two-component system, chemotaxis family, sensor kinase CheA
MSRPSSPRGKSFSIRRLRTYILVGLVVAVGLFTGVMFTLVQRLSERFGPQVRADLVWRAERGAQELAKSADLGLVVGDADMVTESFGAYAKSTDVEAIVAVDATGAVIAQHGAVADVAAVFASAPGVVTSSAHAISSWAPATIEGSEVGKVAVVVSTRRLEDAESLLSSVSHTTLVAGLVGALFGAIVILFFTRAVAQRDAQLNEYAATLEQKVADRTRELDERNRGMRLVLDNVAQGFITIDLQGAMAAERSAVVDAWFRSPAPGTSFAELIRSHDTSFAAWFDLGLDGLRDGFLPVDLCLDQMPKRFTVGDATYDVAYSPIGAADKVEQLLLIVSDVTTLIARERDQREQAELVALFQRVTSDRNGFEEFLAEANGLVESLLEPTDPVVEKRLVHTLKGNCSIYGLGAFTELCHAVETDLAETGAALSETQRQSIVDGWRSVVAKISKLLGTSHRNVVEVEHAELAKLVDRARQGVSSRDLAAVLASWTHVPIARHLERLGDHAKALGRRLGKGEIAVEIHDPGQLRLDGGRWSAFWAAMVHALRNSIDHGLESTDDREAAGKPLAGRITLSAARTKEQLRIRIEDDGRGIDWDAVRRKAAAVGLPADTHDELVASLFADGVSTREQATETSGRGIGLAALREAVTALDGVVEVDSAGGRGTSFTCAFPYHDPQIVALRPPTQPIRRPA